MKRPRGEIPLLDRLKQVLHGIVRIRTRDFRGLLRRQALDSLVCFEVKLHPVRLVCGADPFVGVGTVTVHVTHPVGDPTGGEENQNLGGKGLWMWREDQIWITHFGLFSGPKLGEGTEISKRMNMKY